MKNDLQTQKQVYYIHSNTAARKNIPIILIVSITKLLIELSIIVLIFDIK